ncbi:hypothetical protein [Dyadobacter diqingensis]|uniref:hypothetical protein n=1 Tax=Dyadobacter diqingensis TaxID=2938121 RepID=UPI0020C1911C|nr:hypothetical protein [Dyadobacter diqingensis]
MNLNYYLIGNAGLCFLCIIVLFKTVAGKRNPLQQNDGWFLSGIVFFLMVTKLFSYKAGMLNIDESIMMTGGRTLGYDPRPWISLDPTTSGPLNFLPSLILLKTADWASYGELRIFYTLIFQIPSILLLFFTIRKIAGANTARITIIPLVLTFSFFHYADLIHASSEHLPLLFLAIVISVLLRISLENEVGKLELIVAGIACAASFYAKLQVTPIFLFLAGACFIVLILIKGKPREAFIFLSGFILTHALALIAIWIYGGFDDFIQSYIVGNLRYTTVNAFNPEMFKTFLKSSIRSLLPLLVFSLVLPGLFLSKIKNNLKPVDLIYHAGFLATLVITAYCIAKPGRYFLHYTLLLVVPLYGYIIWLLLKYNWQPGRLIPPLFSLAIAFIFYVNAKNVVRTLANEKQHLNDIIDQKLVDRIYSNRLPGDRMAVWGWGSYYNHATRMIMGTRDVHFDFQTTYKSDLGKYYQRRYLADLETNMPKYFLDLSLPGGLMTNESCQLTQYPEINQFVKKNYREVYRSGFEVLYQKTSETRSK